MPSSPSITDVRDVLVRLLHEIGRIPHERISDASAVDAELRMESVVFIELQVALEDEFQIELDPVTIVELNQFSAIVEYVYSQIVKHS